MSICGTCTMCCKHGGIADELRGEPFKKPDGVWCPHCAIGRGCKVYEDRPQTCREYQCAYFAGMLKGDKLDPDLRPDRCGVIVSQTTKANILAVWIDRHKPDVWRHGKIGDLLMGLARRGIALSISVGTSDRKLVVKKQRNGDVVIGSQEFSPPDERGMQWSKEGTWRYIETLMRQDAAGSRKNFQPQLRTITYE